MGTLFQAGVTTIPGDIGDHRYVLRVPVRTKGKEPITKLEDIEPVEMDGIEVELASDPPYLILTAYDFPTEAVALAFLPKAVLVFWDLAIRCNLAFTADFSPRELTRGDDPEEAAVNLEKNFRLPNDGPIHGLVEFDGVCALPAGGRIALLRLGDIEVSVSRQGSKVIPMIREALSVSGAAELVADDDLSTAMDLFISQFYEASLRARFLTLIMILEILAPITHKHRAAQELLKGWKEDLKRERESGQHGEEGLRALESLDRELGFRRETSIRQRVRAFVQDVFADSDRRDEFVSLAIDAYDDRGQLVHEGSLSKKRLSEVHDEALMVVKATLLRKLGLQEG